MHVVAFVYMYVLVISERSDRLLNALIKHVSTPGMQRIGSPKIPLARNGPADTGLAQ